jgi:hypothetical protein
LIWFAFMRSRLARLNVLHRQHMHGAMPHELQPPAPKIAQSSLDHWIDIRFAQNPQAQQPRKLRRIIVIAAALQSVVLLRRRRVRERDPVACRLQPIDQPVPVVGRFHRHPGELPPIRLQSLQHLAQLVRQPAPVEHPIGFVAHEQHVIVRMQVDPAIHFQHGLLLGLKQLRTKSLYPHRPHQAVGGRLDDFQSLKAKTKKIRALTP